MAMNYDKMNLKRQSHAGNAAKLAGASALRRGMLSVAILATLLLGSCSKAAEAPLESGAYPQKEEAAAINAAVKAEAPWYQAELEALGFYVFPSPESLPSISVKTLEEKPATPADMAGKVLLLNFWATWCPPCKAEMPSIQALYDKTRDVAFDVMAISVAEKKATVAQFLKDNPRYTFPVFLDESGSASGPFVGRGIPTTFILDKQGRAIAGIVGSRSYDGPEVVRLMRSLAERLP